MKLLESLFRFYTLVGRKAPRFSTACLFCVAVLYIALNSSMPGVAKVFVALIFFLYMDSVILIALIADLYGDVPD